MLGALTTNDVDSFAREVQVLLSSKLRSSYTHTHVLVPSSLRSQVSPEADVVSCIRRSTVAGPFMPLGRGGQERGGQGEEYCGGHESTGW